MNPTNPADRGTTRPIRRRFPRAQRRDMIEYAALTVFAERGYTGARMDDIAAAAAVTKQLLYQHFSSKKTLFIALLHKHRQELLGQLSQDLLDGDPSPRERVSHAMDRWLGYVQTHPQETVLLFRDTTDDAELHAIYHQMQADARAVVAASIARRRPTLNPILIEPLAEMMRAGHVGLALWWIEHPLIPRETMLKLILADPTADLFENEASPTDVTHASTSA